LTLVFTVTPGYIDEGRTLPQLFMSNKPLRWTTTTNKCPYILSFSYIYG